MKQTITPERLLGEYIGTLTGICAWDIPEQLREKLERRVKELEELQIEMEVQHRFKENSDKQIEERLHEGDIELFGQKAFEHANKLKSKEFWELYNKTMSQPTKLTFPIYNKEADEDVFDITTMD